MPQRKKQGRPPETEVLSVSAPRPATPEDLGNDPTLPNPELVPPPGAEANVPFEQPFTIDEGGGPSEPEEPTHNPLQDTKAALTKTQQELAEIKRLNQALAHQMEINQIGGGQPGTGQPVPPQMAEFLSPAPIQGETQYEDPQFPGRFMQRQNMIREMREKQRRVQEGMKRFVQNHKDFPEHMEEMRLLKAENPEAYVEVEGLELLYERAKERRELREAREKALEIQQRALQAGVNMANQSRGRQFVPPQGGGTGIPSTQPKVPADFRLWNAAKRKQWLEQNGYVKPDAY